MYKIIPMTRLGQESYQKNRAAVYREVNRLLGEGKKVFQVKEKSKWTTENFPEGHLLFPGTFLIDENESIDGVILDKTAQFNAAFLSELKLPKKIAFLDGTNCTSFCSDPFQTFYHAYGLTVDWITDQDIRKGVLNEYELLIIPGGPDAGESYYEGLGEKGYNEIRQFVERGGLYLGSCAGSYFPLKAEKNTPQSDVWLNMIEVTDDYGLDYWRTGTGFVRIEVEDVTHPIMNSLALGNPSTIDVIYWEGPAFNILDEANVKVIARYKDFLASGVQLPSWSLENNQIAKEAMEWGNPLTAQRFNEHLKGYPAIIEASMGKGHLVLLSPHAEFGTCGTEHTMEDNPNFVLLMNSIYYLSTREELK